MATEDENTEDLTRDDQIEGEAGEAEADLADMTDDADTGEVTEEELDALTEEERAALAEGDEDGDGDGDGDDGAADDAPPADAAAAQDDTTNGDAQPDPEPVKVDPAVTEKILSQAKADKKALFAQYEDGELTRDQYLEGLEKIDTESANAAAQAALEVQQEAQEYEAWQKEARGYLAEVPELSTEAHLQAFDAHVRRVTNDPASAKLSYRQMLEKAHRYYLADQPEVATPIPALPASRRAGAAPKKEAAPAPAAQRPEPPITLARIPSAVPSAVSDGRYGQLQKAVDDAQTAEEVERIMAGMTEAEREAFASMDV